jgi:hypothetical protein
MIVSFALRFENRDVANRAGETLRSGGYDVSAQGQADESVIVMASVATAPSSDRLTAAESRIQVLVEELGGEYLGRGGLS